MSMIAIKSHRTMVIGWIVGLVLAYPALHLGKWLGNHVSDSFTRAFSEQAESMTLVFGPMMPITIDGKAAKALGINVCPSHQGDNVRWLFGESAHAGVQQCIVVTPETKKVWVSLLVDGSLGPSEEWTVERDGGKVALKRPNGSYVMAAIATALH